jgi:hypothetical protein
MFKEQLPVGIMVMPIRKSLFRVLWLPRVFDLCQAVCFIGNAPGCRRINILKDLYRWQSRGFGFFICLRRESFLNIITKA